VSAEVVRRQLCWALMLGLEEIVVVGHRPKRPHRARTGETSERQAGWWWARPPEVARAPEPVEVRPETAEPRHLEATTAQAPLDHRSSDQLRQAPNPVTQEPRRSLHPCKATRAEKATWVQLPRGWDTDRPIQRADCEGNTPCPWCGEPVAMRITYATEAGQMDCPLCKGLVAYLPGKSGSWSWAQRDYGPLTVKQERTMVLDPDQIPMRARNRCRPCWMVRCTRHLYLSVKEDCGSIKLNHKGVGPEDMWRLEDTCADDVAAREEGRVGRERLLPLEVVGAKLGLTLERARQIEGEALQLAKVHEMREERMALAGRRPKQG
jgi:hypothetical protein